MARHRVRGSGWNETDVDPPASRNVTMSVLDNLLEDLSGFRLVSDDGPRISRGSAYSTKWAISRGTSTLGSGPSHHAAFIGLRLVREDT